jgi:hypothetical protein
MATSRESIGCNGFVRRHALRSQESEEVNEEVLLNRTRDE